MGLNERQMKVLGHVLRQNKFSLSEIADEFEINTRTLYRDINKILKWLVENNIVFEADQIHGLDDVWKARREVGTRLKTVIPKEIKKTKYDSESRKMLILTELLLDTEPVKVYAIADKLNVSEGTVISDLDKVEQWLENYEITLIRRQGLGVYAQGSEKSFRNAILAVVYQGTELKELRDMIKEKFTADLVNRTRYDIADRLLGLVDSRSIKIVEESIDSMERDLGETFSDDSYLGLLIHIVLAISRLKKGETIAVSKEIEESLITTHEYGIAMKAGEKLEDAFGIRIPPEEIVYITMHLRGAKVIENGEIIPGSVSKHSARDIAVQLLNKASEISGVDFMEDEDLLRSLIMHLRPAITRLELHMEIRNPLLEQIKEQYSDVYRLSVKVCELLGELLERSVPEEEIGFIAMHLGAYLERFKSSEIEKSDILVVCPSGLGTSRLLTSKINKEIKEVRVLGTTSIEESENLIAMYPTIDMVVSTVDLGERDYDYVVVSPLLNERDINKIKSNLGLKTKDHSDLESRVDTGAKDVEQDFEIYRLRNYLKSMEKLMKDFFIKEDLLIKTSEEMIRYISRFVHPQNTENAKHLNLEIDRRERLMGTALPGEGMALVHTRTSTFQGIRVGVFRSKSQMIFYDMEGKKEQINTVLMLLAGEEAEREDLEVLSKISAGLIENKKFAKYIKEGTLDQVKAELNSIFKTFVREYVIK
ncbi:BglG family transcription antiterminator [Alkalibacter mobilis]|uniref:BglG family transcription antiterminator n=1 Tax=Alkalibacter mobilis TaxID=2787712 RepID=UPI0018A09029|nr:PRD domain-containing protein [Alkalibacter mobilis]MBF7096044.1 PRD domain-containing protein [Alkalibacter mobilis]